MHDVEGPERLGDEDEAILRLESTAIKGHTAKLAILEPALEGVLDLERLRRRVAAGVERMPRARQRIAYPEGAEGAPCWEDDPSLDLTAHVVAAEADQPMSRERLREACGTLMSERLDHERPLWRLDVLGPLEGGGQAILIRVHHSMCDGIAAVRFAQAVVWDEAPPTAGSIESPELSRTPPPPDAKRRRRRAFIPGALARELIPRAKDSPLDRHIGARRALAFSCAPLADLKRIEAAVGARIAHRVTVNDVFLALVAGSLRRWLDEEGDGVRRMRVKVPVSMHHRSEDPRELGNRDSFLYVDLPVGEADPVRRVELISDETAKRKLRGDADELYSFFHAVSHLGSLGRAAARMAAGPHEFSLAASNVPGPREPVSVQGAAVSELYSIAEPADRHALRLTALSCAGTMGFGLCTDPDAVPGVDALAAGLDDSLGELLERC